MNSKDLQYYSAYNLIAAALPSNFMLINEVKLYNASKIIGCKYYGHRKNYLNAY